MKLSDYIVISDPDITYANTVSNGVCNDCKHEVTGKSVRCPSCKAIFNRVCSKLKMRARRSKRRRYCLDCGMEISRFRRCAVCKIKHNKERAKAVYEADRRLSRFYSPKESQK